MASEVQFSFKSTATCYYLLRNTVSQIWNTSGGVGAFQNYDTAVYDQFDIAVTEQGTSSAFYVGNLPSTLAPGVYSITAKQQIGGTVAETDPTVAVGDIQWNGSTVIPLSNLTTSGQLALGLPIRLARGTMIQNFPIYLKSAADHITPFTSGVVSGQIARDGGSFGAFQSGAFTEIGLGWYNLAAITSGDALGNTAKMVFTANGVSGGASDPLPLAFILQRTSGQ